VAAESETILLVDGDEIGAVRLADELCARGLFVCVVRDASAAIPMLESAALATVLVDVSTMHGDALEFIAGLRSKHPQVHVVATAAFLDVQGTVRAMQAGAHDVIEKPLCASHLQARLRASALCAPPSELVLRGTTGAILGEAPAIRAVREQVRTVARYRDLPVLITGETGTGKELVAQAVHASSETDGPFVPVNCAAIPEHLFESELFGHEAGAFTGAKGARAGLFEAAAAGTLFLDEIGELPSTLQPKLLRALETRSFRRVGSTRDVPFRARLVSATHRTLTSPDSLLRSDLYYRLAGFTIATPPLRERSSDLDALATHFLSDFAARYTMRVEFSPRALEALHAYDWPGNVRELRAVVQQAAVLSGGERVGVAELTAALRDRKQTGAPQPRQSGVYAAARVPTPVAQEPLRALEQRTIADAWASSGNNLSATARGLGLSRSTLRDRLRKYGLL
jgi:DNA-binding NtrC family response regulator